MKNESGKESQMKNESGKENQMKYEEKHGGGSPAHI